MWQVSKLLNKYYEKVGQAAAGNGSCPRFTSFQAGFGFIDESTTPPTILGIPATTTEVPEVFYSGSVTCAFSNGATIVTCEIPRGAVEEPVKCNTIGVLDQDGELVAICVTLPDWVTPTEIYRAYPTVTYPIEV